MRITKNVLSIILVIAMLLTAAPMSVYGFAIGDTGLTVDSEDDTINTAQSDTLIRPNATLSVTPVTSPSLPGEPDTKVRTTATG